MRISREELYREIWSQPATKLAQRYDVSSSYLARVCEALNVPHPPRGYWARKAVGEKMAVPPLPHAGPGDPLAWEKGVAVLERLPAIELPSGPKSRGKVPFPSRPAHHPLVTSWRGFMEEATATDAGYMVPRKRNVLDAFATKSMIRAAGQALDALLVELEMRGHNVRLSPDTYNHRPPVDVAQRPIRDLYNRRPNEWQPGRPTIAYVNNAQFGLTLFELTEHVRVRRIGADRYVRISDLAPVRRYAPQAPDEADETRDMPTGRFVLRAYSPRNDAVWQHEWTEGHKGEFVTMAKAIVDALEDAAPKVVSLVEDANRRERERQAQAAIDVRRRRARERFEARQRAREAASQELRAIVKAWNEAFAVEAFFLEVSRRAAALDAGPRAELEAKIQAARELTGGPDAVSRFLNWKSPEAASSVEADEGDDDREDEDD